MTAPAPRPAALALADERLLARQEYAEVLRWRVSPINQKKAQMRRLAAVVPIVAVAAAVSPSTVSAAGPSASANCTAQFVVNDVIQAGAPHGASEDLAPIARPPKTATEPPLKSDVGSASSTNCA